MAVEPGEDQRAGLHLLTSPVRRAIVDALANRAPCDDSGMTIDQLADVLDLHRTTVRFHLDQLAEAGLVTADFTRRFGVGRPRKIYRVATGSLTQAEGHEALRLMSELLTESFGQAELTPFEAGERWVGRHLGAGVDEPPAETLEAWLGKIARMIEVLRVWGYTPELSTSEQGRAVSIQLTDCPLMSLAEANPAVVCGIHRGLISGSMKHLGEPVTQVSLEPFVEPGRCQALVRTDRPLHPQQVTTRQDQP